MFIRLHQILCLLLFFFFPHPSSSLNHSPPSCIPGEKSLLLQFKNTISNRSDSNFYPSTSTSKMNSWNQTTNCCVWEGVTCNKVKGHVISLDLSGSGLVGTLPANCSLFLLQELRELNFAFNEIHGSIPSTLFAQLVSLTRLNFSHCSFSGLVPSEISLQSKLVSLDLSHTFLTFDKNNFGLLARNLSKLRKLVLDDTDMSNVPPASFLNLTSCLKHLSLRSSNLDGNFPNELFHFPDLNYLDLSDNTYLSGNLFQSNWSSPLSVLDISFCDFKGSIPACLGNLTKISYLSLSSNNFKGQFPDVFQNLNRLTVFESYYCNFSGELPSTIFNLTLLTHLDFSNSKLEGHLPVHVGGLGGLEMLDLSNNKISGAVPSWLFALPSLQVLNLAYNNLVGQLQETPKPNSIQIVDLAYNHIYGPIPSSLFDLANLSVLDMSSNNLSGIVKSDMLAKLKSLISLDLSSNNLLTLSGSDQGDDNYTFNVLKVISISSCNVLRFPNFLRTARSLIDLDLSNNKINGSIFKWESEGWELLYSLNLSYNFLTGLEKVPGDKLHLLDLRSNLIEGPFITPPPNLEEFYISKNKLTGKYPPLICSMRILRVLDLSRNNLTGVIPPCLANSCQYLVTLDLQMNNFHGHIPAVDCGLLQNLALNDNQFKGPVPRSLVNCTSLVLLNLANNNLNDTFPHWLGKLPELRYLILRSNGFHGRINNSMQTFSFPKLQIVDLSHNEFIGPLPAKLFKSFSSTHQDSCIHKGTYGTCMPLEYHDRLKVTLKRLLLELEQGVILTSFRMIDFSSNQFSGPIHEVFGEFVSLHVLNLSYNNLIGHIPPSLGNMEALESLDLSSNKLSERIPFELTKLTFLEVLNLSNNNLKGPIPLSNQFGTFGNDSYKGNPRLCGFPLSKKCGNIPEPPSSADQDDSSIPFIWIVVMMGYGYGMVLGLSMGYIVFKNRRPWWFVKVVEKYLEYNLIKWVCRIKRRNYHQS